MYFVIIIPLLTRMSNVPPNNLEGSTGVDPLNSTLSTPWDFLNPTMDLHGAIAGSTKYFFDALANSVSCSQFSRLQNTRKRKRPELREDPSDHVLQLKQLYVDGFTSDQIWEQAVRILDSTGSEVERDNTHTKRLPSNAQTPPVYPGVAASEFEDSEHSDTGDSMEDDENQPTSYDDETDLESVSEPQNAFHGGSDMGEVSAEEFDRDSVLPQSDSESKYDTYKEDAFGLNDGFFSIDDFNAQTELVEKEDARGRPTEDVDSDDEEIDWHANPLVPGKTASLTKDPPSTDDKAEDDRISDSEEDGPTFGNADLHGRSDSEDGDDDNNDGNNDAGVGNGSGWIDTSDIKYANFFAPPPRKVTSKTSRPLTKTQPDGANLRKDVDRAITDVRRDLFEDEVSDEDEEVTDDDIGGSRRPRSTHEKQRARIADEIRRLEAANVAKKEWMLSGEARAAERPTNSLIEEELDFERIGKPVPVVTTEVSEDIEDLVKRRILAKEFDEIIRRRPGTSDRHDARRPRFELEDTKPQQSLAEIYESDHLRATDPNYVDPKNQKLAREHTEITAFWKEISNQLDTLSNWHYKPKAPQANINVITDVATVSMEDARPTANGAVNEWAALAPQEVYAPGNDGKSAGEVVLKTGASVAKDEMTREDKAKLRRQQKKQRKGSGGRANQQSDKAAEKQQVVSDLKKGGVKVIDKEGGITDIHGSKVDGANTKSSGDTLKL